MDITRINETTYKVKGKKGVVTVVIGRSVEIMGAVSKSPFPITQPGEYEVEGISVFAYQAGKTLATLIQVEEVKVLAIEEPLSDALIEEMDTVDVVLLGTGAVPSKELVALVGRIEPSCVVPAGDEASIAAFVKDFEHTSRTSDKLSLSKATMATDITDVVVLNS